MTTEKEVKQKLSDSKTSRRMRDYGLPRLTWAEAARVLGVEIGELKVWWMETRKVGAGSWSKWLNNRDELPEPIIRLFLEYRAKKVEAAVAHAPPPTPVPPSKSLTQRPRITRVAGKGRG